VIDHPALRRLLDLDDPEHHDRAANYLVTARELQLYIDLPVVGDYDLAHLQAIHRFLHHDAWPEAAGRLRDDPNVASQTGVALREDTPERLSHLDRDQIAGRLGGVLADLAAIDPFPMGSGRAARAYTNLLANESGWVICWQRLADHPDLAAGNDPRHAVGWLVEPASPGAAWRELTRQLAAHPTRALALER
jgi:cell filamentation protein